MLARLRDPEHRARILAEIAGEPWDWNTVQIGIARNRRETQGMTLAELGAQEGKSPAEAALDLLLDEEGWVAAVHFAMSEEDVEFILSDPHTMIGSDGVANDPASEMAEDKTHPRTYGTFPRVLARYVRDREVLSLPEAVRRMTSLPAQRLRPDRPGHPARRRESRHHRLRPRSTSADSATFDDPHQFPTGIHHVLVNGRLALENGSADGCAVGESSEATIKPLRRVMSRPLGCCSLRSCRLAAAVQVYSSPKATDPLSRTFFVASRRGQRQRGGIIWTGDSL